MFRIAMLRKTFVIAKNRTFCIFGWKTRNRMKFVTIKNPMLKIMPAVNRLSKLRAAARAPKIMYIGMFTAE